MSQIAQEDFTNNLFKLLMETFEGPPAEGGSAYLDKGAGLFQTLGSLPAEMASRDPTPGSPTIAAHCAHLSYYMRVLHAFAVGQEPQLDWPSSWRTQRVTPSEWDRLRDELRAEYEQLRASLHSLASWGDEQVGDSMAIVVHSAYHLGAIRQVLKSALSPQEPELAASDAQPN